MTNLGTPPDCPPARVTEQLRQRTWTLHRRAERSGIIAELVRGTACRSAYTLFLRNMLPVYRHLERALEAHRFSPMLAPLLRPELVRAGALATDVEALGGPDAQRALPLLEPAQAYVSRIENASQWNGGAGLIAHAYVRYMGDLNGGQIMGRVLARSLALPRSALNFYRFPQIRDMPDFIDRYRALLDRAGEQAGSLGLILDEAEEAFRLNIALSEEVQRAAGPNAAAAE